MSAWHSANLVLNLVNRFKGAYLYGKNKETNDKTPKTGDESNAFMWIAIMLAAGCGIAVTTASRKRQSR